MRIGSLLPTLAILAWSSLPGVLWFGGTQAELDAAPATETLALSQLLTRMDEEHRSWLGVLDRPTLDLGVYRLPAGASDGQEPHALDEVYYVTEGSACFTAGGETTDVRSGSILFVAAGVEHRFHDIQADLVALVFFSKHPPRETEAGDED